MKEGLFKKKKKNKGHRDTESESRAKEQQSQAERRWWRKQGSSRRQASLRDTAGHLTWGIRSPQFSIKEASPVPQMLSLETTTRSLLQSPHHMHSWGQWAGRVCVGGGGGTAKPEIAALVTSMTTVASPHHIPIRWDLILALGLRISSYSPAGFKGNAGQRFSKTMETTPKHV